MAPLPRKGSSIKSFVLRDIKGDTVQSPGKGLGEPKIIGALHL